METRCQKEKEKCVANSLKRSGSEGEWVKVIEDNVIEDFLYCLLRNSNEHHAHYGTGTQEMLTTYSQNVFITQVKQMKVK